MISLKFLREVADTYIRENFKQIQIYLNRDNVRKSNFRFVEYKLTSANLTPYYHGLDFQPKDVILLSVLPDTATVSFKYSAFTRSTISLQASAPCTVRFYLGAYQEDV